LKSALPPETGARRHGVVQGGCRGAGADIEGGSQSSDDAFRLGGAGTAEAGCVTDGEDGVDAGPAILVVGRSQATGGRIIVVATSKQPCEFIGRQKAITHSDHVRGKASAVHK